MLNKPCIAGRNPTWLWYKFFSTFLVLFSNILLRIFALWEILVCTFHFLCYFCLFWLLVWLLLLFRHPVVSNTLWLHGLQHARLPCPSPAPGVCPRWRPSVMLSSHLILWHPLLRLPFVFPSIRDFSNESSVHIRWSKILELQLQHQSFQWVFN